MSGPTSSWMTASASRAISSVRSMRVPTGALTRSWNCPESTCGKISVPRWPPTSQTISAGADQVSGQQHPAEAEHHAVQEAARTPAGSARRRSAAGLRVGRPVSACLRSSQTDSTGTNVLDRM